MKRLFGRLPKSTVAENSPLRLTQLGDEVAEDLKAAAWARAVAQDLQAEVTGSRPDQIHEFCFSYVHDKYQPDTDLERAISIAAYEKGIDKIEVLNVLAVVLRDQLLEQVA